MIDRDDDGSENVYFMNLADEENLFSLLDEDAQAEYLAANQITIMEEVEETETEDEEEIEEEPEVTTEKKSNWAPLILLAIVAVGVPAMQATSTSLRKRRTRRQPSRIRMPIIRMKTMRNTISLKRTTTRKTKRTERTILRVPAMIRQILTETNKTMG